MHRNCVAAEATRSEGCGRGSIREEREEAVTRVQVSSHLVHSTVSTRGLIEWEELAGTKIEGYLRPCLAFWLDFESTVLTKSSSRTAGSSGEID